MYTTTEADSRPITSLKVQAVADGTPCADPYGLPAECQLKDDRYYRVQEDSAEAYFGNYFWARPTIGWSLDCTSAQMEEAVAAVYDVGYSLGHMEALLEQPVDPTAAYGEDGTSASVAEKARLCVVATFVACLLEFLVVTWVWKSCWGHKASYWACRGLFMLYYVLVTALGVVTVGTWAAAESDVHTAYAALASGPANQCGDVYTRFPYELPGLAAPAIPRTARHLLVVAVCQLVVFYLHTAANLAFSCWACCGGAGPRPKP